MTLATTATFATVYRTIGMALFIIVLIAAVTYALVNVLFSGKEELGAEIELAANRKPYYSDEELEGPKLDRTLTLALLLLVVLAIGLPFYWILEPGRQTAAAEDFNASFVRRGEAMFAADGANAQALNCAGCHGGFDGGVVRDYNLTDPETGLIEQVDWRAPALGSVLLRYSREEVRYILTYGRPGTPMPAWGVAGGGPLNDQQVQNVIDFLDDHLADNPDLATELNGQLQAELDAYLQAEFEDGERVFTGPNAEGEALFNMGLLREFQGGAFSCARCHTLGWSYADSPVARVEDGVMIVDREAYEAITANSGCGGGFAFNLCDGATERQFPDDPDAAADELPYHDMVDFVSNGSEQGRAYGVQGQGSGKMPGFGIRPAEPGVYWLNGGQPRPSSTDPEVLTGMLTQDQIAAIVAYERTLISADARAAAAEEEGD